MKHKKFALALAGLLAAVLLCGCGQQETAAQPEQADALPTLEWPGWTEMDREQRVEVARQGSPVTNPFLIEVYAYDSVQEGVQQVSTEFPEMAGVLPLDW